MLPVNVVNILAINQEERLEEIRLENLERRMMREESDCFSIHDVRFRELFRLTKDMSLYVLNAILPTLEQGNNPVAIPAQVKFFAALHFYATGTYQRVIGQSFNISISQQAMSLAIHEVTYAIINTLSEEWIRFPQTEIEKNEIKQQFMEATNFPGVVGAVDCTHIEILRPHEEEHAYLNRKGFHSKNVQIICDYNLKIINVNARYGGATHDAYIWRNSEANAQLEVSFQGGDRNSWLLGDAGYPQQPWLMTPIVNAVPGTPEYQYTQLHIQARNCIERCNGVLKGRFLCLSKILRYTPVKVGNIIAACAILHNICIRGRLDIDFEIPPPPPQDNINVEQPHRANVAMPINEGGNAARLNLIRMYFR